MERNGTSSSAVFAAFSHFCYVGVFGFFSDPVVPVAARGDVVTIYTY